MSKRAPTVTSDDRAKRAKTTEPDNAGYVEVLAESVSFSLPAKTRIQAAAATFRIESVAVKVDQLQVWRKGELYREDKLVDVLLSNGVEGDDRQEMHMYFGASGDGGYHATEYTVTLYRQLTPAVRVEWTSGTRYMTNLQMADLLIYPAELDAAVNDNFIWAYESLVSMIQQCMRETRLPRVDGSDDDRRRALHHATSDFVAQHRAARR